MRQGLAQDGHGPGVAQDAEALDTGQGHAAVGVVGAQPAAQGGEERRYGLGAAQRGEQAYGVQGVGDSQFVGGEGCGRAGGAGVAEPGQGVGGGGAAGRVAVVEEEDERLEGAAVAGQAEAEGGQFAGPQRAAGFGEDGRERVGVLGGHQAFVGGAAARLAP
nr:hypothetical protein [Streptomyces sp. MH191]